MTDEQTTALALFNAASRRVAQNKPNDKGAEAEYGVAYRRIVMLGLVSMPLKRKYRV